MTMLRLSQTEMASALTLTGLARSLRDDEEYTIFAVGSSALNNTLFQVRTNNVTMLVFEALYKIPISYR